MQKGKKLRPQIPFRLSIGQAVRLSRHPPPRISHHLRSGLGLKRRDIPPLAFTNPPLLLGTNVLQASPKLAPQNGRRQKMMQRQYHTPSEHGGIWVLDKDRLLHLLRHQDQNSLPRRNGPLRPRLLRSLNPQRIQMGGTVRIWAMRGILA